MNPILESYERQQSLIKASEDWAGSYARDTQSHAKLIRTESRMQRRLVQFYKELSTHASEIINFVAYNGFVQAYDVEVVVSDLPIDGSDQEFINIMLEEVATATAIGAVASENIYALPQGLSVLDAAIQESARTRVADLVGRKLDKDGLMIDNPKSKYKITNKLREDIRQSIATSITNREPIQTATERLQKVIRNPKRAELIAQTETVNAYQDGAQIFALKAGAVGKQWQAVGAIDRCAQYDRMGPVPINYVYDSLKNLLKPTAHPRCRCDIRWIFPVELENDAEMQKRFRELSKAN